VPLVDSASKLRSAAVVYVLEILMEFQFGGLIALKTVTSLFPVIFYTISLGVAMRIGARNVQ
jgi:hypothetical protein